MHVCKIKMKRKLTFKSGKMTSNVESVSFEPVRPNLRRLHVIVDKVFTDQHLLS